MVQPMRVLGEANDPRIVTHSGGRLNAAPDIAFNVLVAELAEQDIITSPLSVSRLTRSEGLRFKIIAIDLPGGDGADAQAPQNHARYLLTAGGRL
jgi:hypothetical protein